MDREAWHAAVHEATKSPTRLSNWTEDEEEEREKERLLTYRQYHNLGVYIYFVVVQSLNHVLGFGTPWTAACLSSLSFTISQSLLKLMPIELVMPSNYLILWHSLLLLPSIFPSIRIFSNESALHISCPRYWSFSYSIGPSNEYYNCVVVWTFFGIALLWSWDENWPFQSCGHCWVFHICWHIECNTFTASSFRIWNSSTGILSPPPALFIVMLPKAHLIWHSRYLALGEWSHHRGYLGHEDLFCIFFLCILASSS